MNKFQNTVIQLTKKRSEEEFDAFEKEYGTFDDYIEIVETEIPEKPCCIKIEFIEKDAEGYKRWSEAVDNLRGFEEIKKEVKAELKRGPRL